MPATPYVDTAVVDGAWNGPAAEAAISNDAGQSTLQRLYAWRDGSGDANLKGSYKLPHHFVSNGTPGAASISGCRAAMSRLGQSATQIPDADKGAVSSHLQRHIDKYERAHGESSGGSDEGSGDRSEQFDQDMLGLEAPLALQTAGRHWAIRRETVDFLAAHHGKYLSRGMARAFAYAELARNGGAAPAVAGNGVAIVDLKGMIVPEMSALGLMFGCVGGLALFSDQLALAVADPDVTAIVMNVNSPGGLTDMVPEVGAEIMAARAVKPIVAVANTTAASAAYWLAAMAHEVVVTPSGEVGSVGVYTIHNDTSAQFEMRGVRPTVISAGVHKTEDSPFGPMSDEAYANAQRSVQTWYGRFVNAIHSARGGEEPPMDGTAYGGGRTLLAEDAVKAGLADRVMTLRETVQRLSSGRARVRRNDNGAHALDWAETDLVEVEERTVIAYTVEEKNRVLKLAGLR